LIKDGSLLLHKVTEGKGRLKGIAELPTLEQLGLDLANPAENKLLLTRKRGIGNSRITEHIYELTKSPKKLKASLSWIALDKLDEETLSGPHKRWINELLALYRNR